ncbi:sulfate adenylyltransferase subunit 1 [Polynucleobacter sp. AP-Nino-20-G2]|uniref:sulfate adenylyltransferase subunit 1 n=1 Tax=Polynucleobacter sp. AP-Nino-20-G2 TaxID=2576917 RepID=UPI001BFEBFCA|nr:GTP-binding protein [Polynucleobacter sp. AP-Nino-20-G2]QWE16023.1 sulfate adenylyltransferase [Polynucleobacter sp. AP-Nino-20-G2]
MTQENKENIHQNVVRFITAGSVDDGKSTLIGRLLYDTKSILVDQLESLSKTKHARVTSSDAGVDLALLTDGLEAEREQGITIDVAYRYFSTPKRKFIVADAPGHEQYTRNLVTGASQSDVAVILVDAARVDLGTNPATLLAQTKRHAAIVHLLGLRHVVFAVNKMDLLNFDEKIFDAIKTAIEDLNKRIGLPEPTLIPMSALLGANVVSPSDATPWYKGPTLLEWLEGLDTSPQSEKIGLRFPVQYVARQDGSASDDFRGYLGQIESGSIQVGQKIKVLPENREATVAKIYLGNRNQSNANNEVNSAQTGEAVAISLSEDIDVSRGSLFISAEDSTPPTLSKQISADLCWLDSEPLSLSRKYALRHTTNTIGAKVKVIQQVLDVQTLSRTLETHPLNANEIGRVDFTLQKPIAADLFDQSQRTGAFILIDEATNHTVAAGMIREALA